MQNSERDIPIIFCTQKRICCQSLYPMHYVFDNLISHFLAKQLQHLLAYRSQFVEG